MSKPTGDNENSLLRILETIRIASILLILLHFYLYALPDPGPSDDIPGHLRAALTHLPLVGDFLASKAMAFLLLVVSLLGASGRKSPDHSIETGIVLLAAGILLFFASGLALAIGPLYIVLCSAGWLLTLFGGNYLSRVIWHQTAPDVFNRLHESFPQEQRLLNNDHSVNLPTQYQYHGAIIDSWINFVYPQRGTIILGSPGSGKTAYVLQQFIRQMIKKGYAMVLHDFKYDDLSCLAYNYFLKHKASYPPGAAFYNIQFDDLDRSHRCNLLHPSTLTDISEAEEAGRALLLGLNMDWIAKQGDFFVESAITLTKALIWYLRLYEEGKYCSWPHVIELAQVPKNKLFTILRAQPPIVALVNPFVEALVEGANDQLAGQISTTLIALSRLVSPRLYYILTGDDFTLDLNNPAAPKILTLGNNPLMAGTYGPLVSAYLNAVNRLANKKGGHPLAEILEEFSTISVHTIDKTLATGRSNNIAIAICLQNIDQLRLTYGERFADVVFNTCGNVISGQVTGQTARLLSERFGKTLQDRESLTFAYSDVQVSQSHQLEPVIPESRMAALSPGEFVGMVADTPGQPIALKTFCCRVDDPFANFDAEAATFQPLPVVRHVTDSDLDANFAQIRADIAGVVAAEMDRIENSPDLRHLIIP